MSRRPAFPGLPGESVLEAAQGARLRSGAGDGSVPGTLVCTNRRVLFLPRQPPGSHLFHPSTHEVALSCIQELVAVSSFTKPQVLKASTPLRFIPEELLLSCRDFRLLRFHFQQEVGAPQAFRVANAIAQAREASGWSGDNGEGPGGWCCGTEEPWEDEEEEEEEEEDEGSATTLLFENWRDWEEELKRLGAAGWRVSAVNERFDMATSLPRYLWVPSGLLDHDLKRIFPHFEERRVARLCWHHPGGSDLLRAAAFHPESQPGSEDVRCLEALLLGGRGPCVLVDTSDLPTLGDIQGSHLRLRALCLPGAVGEEKWLSALEGTRWLEHVRTCLRKAAEVASLLAGRLCSVLLQEPSDRDLNCLLASLTQLLGDPHARTLHGFQSLVQREWVASGHPFPQRLGILSTHPRQEAPVFLLFLDCSWQLLRQFPLAFGFTETFLLALHDSSFSPCSSTFLFTSQHQRGRGGPPRGQTYTPVSGCQDPPQTHPPPPGVPGVLGKGGGDAPTPPTSSQLPPVWDWGLRYGRQHRSCFRNPGGGTRGPPPQSPPNGERPPQAWPGGGDVFLLTKVGTLSPQSFPWRGTRGSPPHPRLPRWVPSSSSSSSSSLENLGGPQPPPPGLLLPSASAPSVLLWGRCYLRGLPQAQRGRLSPSPSGLAEELQLLQNLLRSWRDRGPPHGAPPPTLGPSR